MKRKLTTRVDDEQGVILVLIAISLVMLLALAGLAVDGYRFYHRRVEQKNIAESVATAALVEYQRKGNHVAFGERVQAAFQKAVEVGAKNFYLGEGAAPLSASSLSSSRNANRSSLVFGSWANGCPSTTDACFTEATDPSRVNAVRLELVDTEETILETIFVKVAGGLSRFRAHRAIAVVRFRGSALQEQKSPFEIVASF